MDERRRRCLEAMGVTVWAMRAAPEAAPSPEAGDVAAPSSAAPVAAAARARVAPDPAALAALADAVAACTLCELHRGRTRTVFGVGAADAECMMIGEAPGAEEDRRGEPFVGRAGKLLDAMLGAIGLAREAVYIANIVKCRPPRNRDPRPDEVAACAQYLRRQIELVAPRVIVALGRVAAQNLLGTTQAIGRLRGLEHVHPGCGVPVIVTYHPAYLLRSPLEKRKAWEDLRRVRTRLEASG